MAWNVVLLRLFLAAFFGSLIGLERERKEWVAGLRTHMMVSVGSCLIMIVSAYGFTEVLGPDNIRLDPARLAAQVVSGIGFIGAGTILFLKQKVVRGLTTAAGLWTVAAIGLATGGGLYFAAGITTVIALIILWSMQPLVNVFMKKHREPFAHVKNIRIIAINQTESVSFVQKVLKEHGLLPETFSIVKVNTERSAIHIKLNESSVFITDEMLVELNNNPDLLEISVE